MKRILLGAPLLLLAATGCSKQPATLPDQTAPVRARVIVITTATVPDGLALTGIVMARQTADISSQVMAPISEFHVREGDPVSKGQVLVRLSSASLAAGVQQADSQLAAARQQAAAADAQKRLAADTFARYQTLNERHSVSPHEFDQVRTGLEAAQAQQQAAAAQVQTAQAGAVQSRAADEFTVIRAPFSGIVTAKFADPGSMASPGTPLLRIEDVREHELDVQVNESAFAKLRPGASVQVRVNGANAPTEARIREIVPGGDPASHTFTVKIALAPSKMLYSGMTASVLIPTGQQQAAITIPRSCIRQRGQLDSVLALDSSSVAQLRYISLGRTLGDQVEVTSGVSAADRVLAQPDDALIGHRIEQQQ